MSVRRTSTLAAGQSATTPDATPRRPSTSLICLILWFHAMGALTLAELRMFGLDAADVERLRREHAFDLMELRRLYICGSGVGREMLAPLLRGRVAELSLAASTPAELAAVARAVKTLPDWVWDQVVVEGDAVGTGLAPSATSPGSTASAAAPRRGQEDLGAANMADAASRVPTEEQPLNRHQRRTLDKLQRSR